MICYIFIFSDFVKIRKKSIIIGIKPIIRQKSINRKSSNNRKIPFIEKIISLEKFLLVEKFYYKKSNIKKPIAKKIWK